MRELIERLYQRNEISKEVMEQLLETYYGR
jgi:hypothetical protein